MPTTGDITFDQIWRRIASGRRTITLFIGIATILAFLATIFYPATYTVSLLVKPIDQTLSGNSSAQTIGTASKLLALAGGAVQSNDFQRYQQLLTATPTAAYLAREPMVMHGIFASEWENQKKQWRPAGIKYYLLGWLYSLAGIPAWTEPDTGRVADFLSAHIQIDSSITSDIITVSFDTRDPAFGEKLLSKINHAADDILRKEAHQQASLQKTYLEEELQKTAVQTSRETLLLLLADQERQLMLTQPGVAFAAQAIGSPTYSTIPTYPKPVAFLVAGIMGGAIMGILMAILTGDIVWSAFSSFPNRVASIRTTAATTHNTKS